MCMTVNSPPVPHLSFVFFHLRLVSREETKRRVRWLYGLHPHRLGVEIEMHRWGKILSMVSVSCSNPWRTIFVFCFFSFVPALCPVSIVRSIYTLAYYCVTWRPPCDIYGMTWLIRLWFCPDDEEMGWGGRVRCVMKGSQTYGVAVRARVQWEPRVSSPVCYTIK